VFGMLQKVIFHTTYYVLTVFGLLLSRIIKRSVPYGICGLMTKAIVLMAQQKIGIGYMVNVTKEP